MAQTDYRINPLVVRVYKVLSLFSVSLVVSEEENGAVFQCEATSSSLEQPLVEQIV